MISCPDCGTQFDTPYCPNCGTAHSDKSKEGNAFFKGAFDSIPFLNTDAKRTFVHLIFRPGYMILDYLRGRHSRYMAPMTALIIFYAFFALMSSIVSPEFTSYTQEEEQEIVSDNYSSDEEVTLGNTHIVINEKEIHNKDSFEDGEAIPEDTELENKVGDVLVLADKLVTFFSLDLHPEAVDTPFKASIAALEATLRSQGLFKFIIQLIFLTLAIWTVFKKRFSFTFSASATTASYILCQFCFLMIFALIITWGNSSRLGLLILISILAIDFHQMFNLKFRESIRATLKTGIWYGIYYGLSLIIIAGIMFAISLV